MARLKQRGEPGCEPLQHPVSCTGCGRTFSGPGAHQVAHEGGRCLPDSMVVGSVLEVIDGVYVLRGREAAQ